MLQVQCRIIPFCKKERRDRIKLLTLKAKRFKLALFRSMHAIRPGFSGIVPDLNLHPGKCPGHKKCPGKKKIRKINNTTEIDQIELKLSIIQIVSYQYTTSCHNCPGLCKPLITPDRSRSQLNGGMSHQSIYVHNFLLLSLNCFHVLMYFNFTCFIFERFFCTFFCMCIECQNYAHYKIYMSLITGLIRIS